MTRNDSLRPPKLASWLLEQFSPVLQNAPLTGDLVESFTQGRSASWYWRQVLVAILFGFLNLFRRKWGCLAYALCCSGVVSTGWWFLWSPSVELGSLRQQLLALFQRQYGMQWPWSLLYVLLLNVLLNTVFQGMTIMIALSVYLGLFRSLSIINLLRAISVVAVVLAGADAVLFLLYAADLGPPGVWWLSFSAITFVALVLGMWRANLSTTLRARSA